MTTTLRSWALCAPAIGLALCLSACSERIEPIVDEDVAKLAKPAPAGAEEREKASGEGGEPVASSEVRSTTRVEWGEFRGPRRDGVVDVAPRARAGVLGEAPQAWGDAGPKIAWRASIGIGFASVSVANDRVFAVGSVKGEDTLRCFEAETGAEVWTRSYPSKLHAELHEGGASATPTVDGDRLYTLTKDGRLLALSTKDGSILWQTVLPDLGFKAPFWGYSGSPLVHGETLILGAGPLIALNKNDGKLAWRSEQSFKTGYGSPIRFELEGKTYVALLNNTGLIVANPANGEIYDSYEWPGMHDTNSTIPLVSGNTLFISSGYKKGCALLVFDEEKLKPAYTSKLMRNHMNSCVEYQGDLFGVDGNTGDPARLQNLVCIDRQSGDLRWKQTGFGAGSLIRVGDKLVILSDKGELTIAKASGEGYEQIARASVLKGRCWTAPVYSAGRIYCRNAKGDLVCIDVRS